jgi:acetyl-CoA carboxylase biotin carboxyl carrier protein
MDIRKIKKLIEMLQDSDLKEIEVSQGEESVRILRENKPSEQVITVNKAKDFEEEST